MTTRRKILKMRSLAARLRGHAAETSLELFQRKFMSVAAELEQAARQIEGRAHFRLAN